MKTKLNPQGFVLAAVFGLLLNWYPATAHAQGTAFVYQGLLQNNNAPCGGAFDFKFLLYTTSSGGTAVAGPFLTNGVTVSGGAFTVTIDFGAAVWNGRTNWLEIAVEANGDSGFTTLAPRQQMTPTPYAIFAETASNLSGTLPIAQLAGKINNSQLANNSLTVTAGSGLTGGGTVALGGATTMGIMAGGVNNSMLASPSITINTGSGLSGGGPVALGGSITLSGTGVTSLTGGDGVTVSGATGELTLGLGSTLTLANLPVAINTENGPLLYADNNGNYFSGLDAGNPGVTGYGNTAGGNGALGGNITGTQNTAYGSFALQNNSSGSDNTALGAGALENGIGGSANTAEGLSALQFNQTGSGNTANGLNALLENDSGSYNVANGLAALLENDNGSYNVASGVGALEQNEFGSFNVSDGAQTLQANQIGNNNTAVGYSALEQLGQNSGRGGTNNIALGFAAGGAFIGNESSNIDIGNIGVMGESFVTRIGDKQTVAYIAGIITGNGSGLTSLNASQITGGTINNSQLANSSITVNPGPGLSAAGSPVALGGTITLNNTGVTSLAGGGGVTVSASSGAVTLGSTATSLNTPNTIVGRDGTGSFSAYNLTLDGILTLSVPQINYGSTPFVYSVGSGNFFAGVYAGNPATTGLYNTGDGWLTLASDTSGSENTASGFSALYANTAGNQNTAIGYSTLYANTTGSQNTAGGEEALADNTTGTDNTASGALALLFSTIGNANTANGAFALENNTNGSENTANGTYALMANVSGNYNTAIGDSALGNLGFNQMGGNNNIALGYNAGGAYTANESGNIDIGNAGVPGENNVTRIGDVQTVAYIAGIITGNGSGLTSLNGSQIAGGTINNSQLANSSITVNPGPGLSAVGSPVALGGTITLNNTGVTSLAGGGGVTVSASSGAVTLGSTATSLNTPTTIVSRDGTGSFSAQNLTLAGILNLPAPPVTINSGASSLVLGDGNRDLFVGLAAGNLTSGAGDNTGLGYEALQAVTSGNQNVAAGSYSLAANTTGNANVALGYESLQQNITGFGNTACGWESLKVNTNGWYDTAIGLWALQLNTTGNNNTAAGYDALGGNTTGNENTAFGVHANLSNTTGSNNVAVGWWSLNYCPGGSGNIAVGYQAGINFGYAESGNIDIGNGGVNGDNNTIRIGSVNNTDSNNVANTYIAGIWATPVSLGLPVVVDSSGHLGVQPSAASSGHSTADGYQALYTNPNGYQNTADGYQALFSDTSGGNNTAVGNVALAANKSGSANTAVGNAALDQNTSGDDNTAVGESALGGNTTGFANTAVGISALDEITTGTGNIAIGGEAGSQLLNGNENNNIDIGNDGVQGENGIIRIGDPLVQTATYLAGICNSKGYGCQQGINGTSYGNSFNFWWTGSQLQAWVDTTDIGVVQVTSDRRLKESIQPMTDDALTRVMALKPSSFKYKSIPGTVFQGDGTKEEGFIADELQQVIPSAVNGQTNAVTSKGTIQPQTVNLIPVVAVLTKAVQEQEHEITQVAELKSENIELKAQLTELRSQLDALQKAVARLTTKSSGVLTMNTQP